MGCGDPMGGNHHLGCGDPLGGGDMGCGDPMKGDHMGCVGAAAGEAQPAPPAPPAPIRPTRATDRTGDPTDSQPIGLRLEASVSSNTMPRRHHSAEIPTHSWELPGRQWDESDRESSSEDPDSDDGPRVENSPEECGEIFVQFVMSMYFSGALSAKSACVLCWWAGKAGARGPVSEYGFRPNAPTGHYARHIDTVEKIDVRALREQLLALPVPRYTKYDAGRSVFLLPVRAPHEELVAEIEADPGILRAAREEAWPPSYWGHPTVRTAMDEEVVLPCALYVDGVPTTKRDGVTGFWCYNLVSCQRHLLAVLRKSELCKCGCKGFCSIWAVFQMLFWSFKALADGVWPSRGPFGERFPAGSERLRRSGTAFPCKAVLLQVKGDWLEFTSTFGMANWRTAVAPCFMCHCTTSNMYEFMQFAPGSNTFPPASASDYAAACAGCRITTMISRADHADLKASLRYDKRKVGARGRAVQKDIPSLGLLRNDRLEPTPSAPDPGRFEEIADFPTTAVFWRRASETRVRRHNPLMDLPGMGPHLFCVDALHTLYLGPARDWVASVFWLCITSKTFWPQGGDLDETSAMTMLQLRQHLTKWYSDWSHHNPGQQLTQVDNLDVGMLGPRDRPMMSTKGAETKGLIEFSMHILDKYRAPLGARARPLFRCGEAIRELVSVMDTAPRVMRPNDVQRFHDAFLTLARFWVEAGLTRKPKMHLLMHLVGGCGFAGNPGWFTTFEDESLNKALANVCRAAHRANFELRVMAHFRAAQTLARSDGSRKVARR